MKICMIDPALFTWPYDSALIGGLLANGHEVHFFSKAMPAGALKDTSAQCHQIFYPGLEKPVFGKLPRPAFLAVKGLLHFISYFRLIRELHRLKPDVIHFQWAPLPVVDLLFLPFLRRIAPLVLTVHDSSPFNNNPSARLQRIGAFRIMRVFDRLIVHTEKARDAIISHGVDPARIMRIAHGVLGSGPAIEATTAGTSTDRPMNILLFGKLKPYKGADLLIEALARLSDAQRRRCCLQIVGKAEMDTAPLHDLAKRLGVENCIKWDLRFVDDEEMSRIFSDADVMAMPYRQIDASGVLMVALGMGRPILASRIGLFAELLEDGRHGFLVPPEDPAAIAVALARLLDDPQGRQTMGANVRALEKAIPGWQEIGQQTAALYQSAIADH